MKDLIRGLDFENDFFVFKKDEKENPIENEKDLIEMKIYGISLGPDQSRPVVVFRDISEKIHLPVPVAPVQAGVILAHTSPSVTPSSVHHITELILNSLNINISKCVFVEVSGHHQYVRLYFENHPNYGSIKVRADEAIGLCLHFKVSMFATKDFINKSRVMMSQIDESMKVSPQNLMLMDRRQGFLQ